MTEPDANVYVYGVLRAADAGKLDAAGVAGATVRTITHGELAALVSDVEGDSLAAAREVRAHWRVLEEASSSATVLPVRFGTVMEGDEAVRKRLLEANRERLVASLEQLVGRVQLIVKAEYEEGALLRDVVKGRPALDQQRRRIQALPEDAGYYERIRLGEAVAAGVEQRRNADTEFALARLSPHAVASQAEATSSPDAAFNLAFLVDRDRIDGFSAAVGELGREYGDTLKLRYVGPLPPYSFADIDLAESAGWA